MNKYINIYKVERKGRKLEFEQIFILNDIIKNYDYNLMVYY